jgi:hypothetical protein
MELLLLEEHEKKGLSRILEKSWYQTLVLDLSEFRDF